jgi:ferric-dicitrate binding protein FerR (iron transport regulator)
MLSPEQNKLIADFLAGKAVGEELLQECQKDEAVLQTLAEQTATDRLLHLSIVEESEASFAAELCERLSVPANPEFTEGVESRLRQSQKVRSRWRRGLAAAACLAVAGLAALLVQAKPAFGQIVTSRDAVWNKSSQIHGDVLMGRKIQLSEGHSKIELLNGVRLILEGPVDLEIVSDDEIRLFQGSLVADVPKNAIGFRVQTENSEIVDLGTVFGVATSSDGASEVHVLEGEVMARPRNRAEFVHLTEDRGLVIDATQQVTEIKSDPERFLRALPGQSAENPEFLHWSFDRASEFAECEGTGINGQLYPGKLSAFNDGEGPVYGPGKFGEALHFNGIDAYVKTDFPGIGDNHPRTIVFWAKVPKDFSVNNGYGMMAWGLFETEAAWQISPNPTIEDGPLGRIRIGTNEASIIGTTDLRDGRWHHIAIVMYGGDEADLSTHVLLYIDGQLEKTSVKSIASIDTVINDEASRPLIFGRNIEFADDESPPVDRFFEGWIDEVYIFNTALGTEQIQSLFQVNAWDPTEGD